MKKISKNKRTSVVDRIIIGYAERDAILWKMGFETYADYLKSDIWKEIRHNILMTANFRCSLCHKPSNQVHHLWYSKENLSGEDIQGLVAICRVCHHSIEFSSLIDKHEPQEAAFLFDQLSKVQDIKDITKTRNKLQRAMPEKFRYDQILRTVRSRIKYLKKHPDCTEWLKEYQQCWVRLRDAKKLRNQFGHFWDMKPNKKFKKQLNEKHLRKKLLSLKQ